MSIFYFYLGISRYCVRCLSCGPCQSGDDVHDFCGRHLWCWWSLFREYCVWSRIIFYNVTSEYDSAFVLLILRFWLRILKMTKIHQWRKMNFSALSPCFSDHSFLFLTFASYHVPYFSTAALAFVFFLMLEASEWICAQEYIDSMNSSPLQWCDLGDVCVQLFPIVPS